MERFKALDFKPRRIGGGIQATMDFPNGYTASVVRGPGTYGAPNLYELAVLRDGELVYDTPITDDVLGWLSEAAVDETLGRILDLPEEHA